MYTQQYLRNTANTPQIFEWFLIGLRKTIIQSKELINQRNTQPFEDLNRKNVYAEYVKNINIKRLK